MNKAVNRFAEQVRDIRKKKGISQEKLAALAGMDHSYLNEIEKGKVNPSLKVMNRISQALKIPLWEIFLRMEPSYKKPGFQELREKKLIRVERKPRS